MYEGHKEGPASGMARARDLVGPRASCSAGSACVPAKHSSFCAAFGAPPCRARRRPTAAECLYRASRTMSHAKNAAMAHAQWRAEADPAFRAVGRARQHTAEPRGRRSPAPAQRRAAVAHAVARAELAALYLVSTRSGRPQWLRRVPRTRGRTGPARRRRAVCVREAEKTYAGT